MTSRCSRDDARCYLRSSSRIFLLKKVFANSPILAPMFISLVSLLVVYSTSHGMIFQLYMWRHICEGGLKKKLYIRSGSQHHRHFAGFFNVPVLHGYGTTLFIRWFRHTTPLVAFYDTLGIRRTYSRLKPRCPKWNGPWSWAADTKCTFDTATVSNQFTFPTTKK